MTTPDQHTGFDRHQRDVGDVADVADTREPVPTPTEGGYEADPPAAAHAQTEAIPHAEATHAEAAAGSAHGEPVTNGDSLFGGIDLSGLKSRWDDVQAAFVDDPRECVQKADHLVSDVVEQLTSGFAQARSQLEEQWSRGQEASTEELRVALKRYREFFQRLLSV